MTNLLLIVDMQNDFMQTNGELYVNGAENLIKQTNDFLSKIKPDTIDKILITFDTHDKEEYKTSPESALFPPHCIKETTGHKLAIDIRLIAHKIPISILEKDVFNMWQSKSFDFNYFKGVHNAYVMGVASDFCVKEAIVGLLEKDIKVHWISDLSKGINEQSEAVATKINHKNLRLIKAKDIFQNAR